METSWGASDVGPLKPGTCNTLPSQWTWSSFDFKINGIGTYAADFFDDDDCTGKLITTLSTTACKTQKDFPGVSLHSLRIRHVNLHGGYSTQPYTWPSTVSE